MWLFELLARWRWMSGRRRSTAFCLGRKIKTSINVLKIGGKRVELKQMNIVMAKHTDDDYLVYIKTKQRKDNITGRRRQTDK